jgi:stage II sporulation protein P
MYNNIYGEYMKKDLLIYFANAIATFCIVLVVINFAPKYTSQITSFNTAVATVFAPNVIFEKISDTSLIKSDEDDNTNNTTSQSVSRSTDGIKGKDSDLYSDITQVPDDIQKLMNDEQEVIDSQEVKGKTSEEEYFGGGTLVSFDKIEIQSKIPTSFYELDIEKLLTQGADLTIDDMSQPTILVYHSHTTESYTLLDVGYYTESLDLRSDDNAKNMVRVGDELVKYLELQGFNVIHDTEIHDTDYSGAYDSSRASVEKYLEEYPSIEITIDVHRDDITYDNNTKVKPTAVINGKKAARMMIIAGAEYGSVTNYPNWEYNLRFDIAIQNKLSEMYDGLMRPILFSERKYNMFETKNSFLLEIGTDGNTLDEACYSARLFAVGLGELLKEEYVKGD